ncbi:SH3 domain-containing protein [Massilia niastensis]|uniref:SH3 domain-containing protein n=1 Tax=Massilia niastensis TaxID=544911 RepID=UPI00037FCFF6|nr:SH3 domain-containing protein [Massilia niastensis]
MSAAHLAAYGAGLALTLCACAWLTPRAWWRRPNLRALGLLAAGTAALGAALAALFVDAPAAPAALAAAPPPSAQPAIPVAGARYRTHDALNLRAAVGVNAPRLAVVPAGSRIVATGRSQGDWWQVRATVGSRDLEGWASSLWLRRADERVQSSSAGSRIGL